MNANIPATRQDRRCEVPAGRDDDLPNTPPKTLLRAFPAILRAFRCWLDHRQSDRPIIYLIMSSVA
jgi:hypothetical protein